jgi:polyhydroxybutyrate depolymerase
MYGVSGGRPSSGTSLMAGSHPSHAAFGRRQGRLRDNGHMKPVAAIAAVLTLALLPGFNAARADAATDSSQTIDVGGVARQYLVHVPLSYDRARPASLVLVFHGGGGEAAGMERISGMNEVSDRHGFIAVYPQGVDRQWKDGRDVPARGSGASLTEMDDVTFIAALISALESKYRIDPKRIYATGISNGAIFSLRLACDLGSEIAAIAPVAGSIPADFQDTCKGQPVSVMMINGTDDKLVPFRGGKVGGPFVGQGYVVPVAQTVSSWVSTDGCAPVSRSFALPDADPNDGTTTAVQSFDRCRNGTAVQLYTISGGGHTWPDGPQYLPQFIVGKVSYDFNASETMWQFFASHPAR